MPDSTAKIRDALAYRTQPWPGVTGDIPFSGCLDDAGEVFLAKYESGKWNYLLRETLGLPPRVAQRPNATGTDRDTLSGVHRGVHRGAEAMHRDVRLRPARPWQTPASHSERQPAKTRQRSAIDGPDRAASAVHLAIFAATIRGVRAECTAAERPFLDRRTQPLEQSSPDRDLPDPNDVTEVRIGYFGPDDPAHPDAADLWRAATLAIELANEQGGYRGKPFRLVARWSDNPWTGGAAEVTRLVYSDRVWAILGGIDGPSTHIAEQVTTKAWLPLLCAASSDRTANAAVVPWMFSLLPGDHLQAPALTKSLASRVAAAPFVVIVGDDHDSRCFMVQFDRCCVTHASHLGSSGSIVRVRSPSPNWRSDRSKPNRRPSW